MGAMYGVGGHCECAQEPRRVHTQPSVLVLDVQHVHMRAMLGKQCS